MTLVEIRPSKVALLFGFFLILLGTTSCALNTDINPATGQQVVAIETAKSGGEPIGDSLTVKQNEPIEIHLVDRSKEFVKVGQYQPVWESTNSNLRIEVSTDGMSALLHADEIGQSQLKVTYGKKVFEIDIELKTPPPTNLSYTYDPYFEKDVSVINISPTVTGTVETWSLVTPLPVGLVFNSSDGSITGTPTETTSNAGIIVKATNNSGSTYTSIEFEVAYRMTVDVAGNGSDSNPGDGI